MKKIIFLFVLMLLLSKIAMAQEFYVMVSTDGKTMRFCYDTYKSLRYGTIYYARVEWKEAAETVTEVIFEDSIVNYRPTSTYWWFGNFSKLRKISGLERLNTSEVKTMQSMFFDCESLKSIDVSQFNTDKVSDMICMFKGCSSLTSIDVRNFYMGNVTQAKSMFNGCSSLTSIDLTDWDLGNIEDLSFMFKGCSNLRTIYVEPNADWSKLPKSPDSKDMFLNCEKLVGGNGTTYYNLVVGNTYARVDKSGAPGYFTVKEFPTIGGQRVKNGTQTMSCITRGTVTYDEENKELTLDNCTIKVTDENDGIFLPDAIYINIVGNNAINTKANGITVVSNDISIGGSGMLNVTSSNGYGISFSDMLEVYNKDGGPMLNIIGAMGALDGRKHYSTFYNEERCGYLSNYNGTLYLATKKSKAADGQWWMDCSEIPVIHNLSSIEGIDQDCFFSYLDYVFDKELYTVVDPGYGLPVTNPFKIVPEEPEGYGVYLGGHLINNANRGNFTPQSLSSGRVKYDPDTNILSMDNAKFDRVYYPIDDGTALSADALDFTIELTGDNTVVGQNDDGYDYLIYMGDWYHSSDKTSDRHYTIRSADPDRTASLHFSNSLMVETYYSNTYVSIENVDIYNDGWYAYFGGGSYYGKVFLSLDNSSINLGEHSTGKSMCDFDDVTLTGCHFANDFYYDTSECVVKDSNGDTSTGPMLIFRDVAVKGDVNGDGVVDEDDVNDVISHVQGDTPEVFDAIAADVNEDGVVNYDDALLIGEIAGVPVGIGGAERLNDKGEMINDKCGGVYDLTGRRLNGRPTKPGVYVRDGRKVVVK